MTVYETDLPNVGRKFELDVDAGGRVAVVLRFDGTRVVYRQRGDADAEKVAELTPEEGRQLGTILAGAYFEPARAESRDVPLGDEQIQWVTVPAGSSLVGRTLGEADVGTRTGADVIAVQHDDETVGNPDASEEIAAGDTLVVLGARAAREKLERLVETSEE